MTRYVRSSHLEIESAEGDSAVVVHNRLGYRLLLNRATQQFLELFEQPLSLEDLARMGPLEKALPSFKKLRRARYLIEEGHQETASDRLLTRVSRGLLGCPPASDTTPPSAVTFLGVPFDCGNTVLPGARFGPAALRRVSQAHFGTYAVDAKTGKPRGWYDNDRESEVLAGVLLADAGDLFNAPSEAPGTLFGKLLEVASGILETGSLPVILGGDHSITFPVLAAFEQPLEIVHIDAHPDLAEYFTGEEHHHGNFMSRALSLDQVTGVYQVGVRGMTLGPQVRAGSKVRKVLTPRQLRREGVAHFVEALPAGGSYYVTFDIDSLDPIYAPGTSTPVPDGLTFAEVKDLLIGIAGRRRCLGFDLVELNPQRDSQDLTAVAAIELLLAFLGAHFRRDGR